MATCGSPRPVKVMDDFFVGGDCSCIVDASEKHSVHACGGGCDWPNVKTCQICLVPVSAWNEVWCGTCLTLAHAGNLIELARRAGVAGNWMLAKQFKGVCTVALTSK